MSTVNGRAITCERCGKTVFCKCTGEEERDGGYTRWNKFEVANGWGYEIGIGDLCPECFESWKVLKADFTKRKASFARGE